MVALLVLAITLGSLVAAGLPLITAMLGVGVGLTGLTALSGVIELSDTAPTLATMLGLAVGIDYALFILSRHRQNLGDGLEPREAAAQATATAGSAVVFAGLTVIIALVGLLVINIPFLSVMGLAAAGTVAVAVLIAITLLPAILGFAGHRIARVNRVLGYRPGRRRATRESASVRYARFITGHPLPVLAVGLALLCTAALPALHMRLGLPDSGSQPTSALCPWRGVRARGLPPGAGDRALDRHGSGTPVAISSGRKAGGVIMEVHIGSHVLGTGGKLGEVHRVIVDARTNNVTDIVVKHGSLMGKERMVPLGCVDHVEDDGSVYLNVDEKVFEAFEGFADDRFRAPDPDYVGPPGFRGDAFLVESMWAGTGGTGAGFGGKPMGYPGGEQLSPDDMQRPSIQPGTPIVDPDGKKIGEVHELAWQADGGSPTRLVMRSGTIFHTDTELPLDWIQNLSDEGVVLNVPRQRVEALREEQHSHSR
jgi:uncharacterized protein YrrD